MIKFIVSIYYIFFSSVISYENPIIEEDELPKIQIIVKYNNQDIVYRGISNPISIIAENNIKFEAKGIGLKKIDDLGNYEMVPKSGKEVIISVIGKLANGKTFKVSKTIKIRDISSGISQFNGKNSKKGSIKLSKKELSSGRVSYDFPGILIKGLKTKIISFKIKLPKKPVQKVFGNRIKSTLLLKDIQKIKRGSQVQIFDIQIRSYIMDKGSLRICKISPILLQITN